MAILEKTAEKSGSNSTVDEFLDRLPEEGKQRALSRLVQEAVRRSGGKNVIPLVTERGEALGYYLPPNDICERVKLAEQSMTVERVESIRQAIATPDDTFDPVEYNRQLSEEDRD